MQPDPNQPNFNGGQAPAEPRGFQPPPTSLPAQYAPSPIPTPAVVMPQPGFTQPVPAVFDPQAAFTARPTVGPPVESFGFAPAPSRVSTAAPIPPAPQGYQQPMATPFPPPQPPQPYPQPQPFTSAAQPGQQLPQPVLPQPPMAGQPFMSAAPLATMSGNPSTGNSFKKSKIPKIIGGIAATAALIGIIATYAISGLGSKQIIYTKSDLTSASTKAYNVSYAKQWTDLSSDQKVLEHLKASIGSDTTLFDQKVYGYKYDPKTDQGQTLLLVADTPLGVTDADLQRGLTDSTAKQQFELSFKALTNSLDSNSLCASTNGKTETIKYDTAKFVVEVKANVDCNYSASSQKKFGTKGIHQSIFLGIKNGNTYLATLVASKDDWTANGKFYQDNIINSVQPK